MCVRSLVRVQRLRWQIAYTLTLSPLPLTLSLSLSGSHCCFSPPSCDLVVAANWPQPGPKSHPPWWSEQAPSHLASSYTTHFSPPYSTHTHTHTQTDTDTHKGCAMTKSSTLGETGFVPKIFSKLDTFCTSRRSTSHFSPVEQFSGFFI